MKLISSLAGSALAASVISVAGRTPLPTGVHEALSEVVTVEYGVDVSFPMHHMNVTDPNPLGDRQTFYEQLIDGCVQHYGEKRGSRCRETERGRIEMSLRQPKGMRNYTKLGYTKIRAPDHVFQLIREFWEANKDNSKPENWTPGNTYVNHWETPTYMASIEDTSMNGGGYALKQMIWNAARDTISEWTGQQLAECSLYGIRIYKEGAVLATHVDRLPLVSSAIINVDQDVDEPWPLEVIGHDGIATNITMVPGDLVLYESHSVLHGRPFPLKGRFMANVFVHFEPIGPVGEEISIDPDLPQYVIPGSEEEKNWRAYHPNGYKIMESSYTTGSTEVHQAALSGNARMVRQLLERKAQLVNARDVNGWMPLHEAVRTGNLETVQVLLDHGADVNGRTKGEGDGATGGSVLYWALRYWPEDHEVVVLLRSRGAKNLAPGSRFRDEL